MFAVPGWSISADALKSQIEESSLDRAAANGSTKQKSRKRKRANDSNTSVEITDENLGDLWKDVIEQRGVKSTKDIQKSQKDRLNPGTAGAKDDTPGEIQDLDDEVFEGLQEDGDEEKTSTPNDLVKDEITKKKKKRKKAKEEINRGHSQVQPTLKPLNSTASETSIKDGKSKYDERKAKAARKREQKALLQANGTLPPTRPESNSTTAGNSLPQNSPKSIKSANPPQNGTSPENNSRENTSDPSKLKSTDSSPDLFSTNTKLTPLQQRMAAKLTSARFRHLNQTLYTSPSDQAMRMFAESPQNYTSYHAGFRAQVAVWPQNPVEGFIQDIKARGSARIPSQKKMWREQRKGKKSKSGGDDNSAPTTTRNVEPLPRNKHGICTIADLGCGDATLAASLLPSKKALNLNLLSFDLAKGDTPNAHLITVADITNLSTVGMKEDSVDVAICCLSLMGTNWVDVVNECNRVVRAGGEMWVAEIKSRFGRAGQAVAKKGDGVGKKRPKGQEDIDEPAEVSELEDLSGKNRKDETDVSAFVEVFRKRGFHLKGEADTSNKMFVQMRFVKAVSRMERGAENEKGGAASFGEGFRGKQKKGKLKFLDEEVEEVDENKVLKPCVYKTR
ncbi:25S rRNA (adenine645-N1)-methyltransferase [Lecanora helva]